MVPGKIIIDDNSTSVVETAVFIGPWSPEVAMLVKFVGITAMSLIKVHETKTGVRLSTYDSRSKIGSAISVANSTEVSYARLEVKQN